MRRTRRQASSVHRRERQRGRREVEEGGEMKNPTPSARGCTSSRHGPERVMALIDGHYL